MNQAEKKFVWYAVLAVFVLLTLLLGILNGTNFTMAARDADALTARIAEGQGAFAGRDFAPDGRVPMGPMGQMGPMGPDAPDMNDSLRYFTFAFDKDGAAQTVSFRISAVDEQEAEDWARSLTGGSTGWTRGTYRYRVYRQDGQVFVTVIDQGREMLSAYRILIFSVAGTLVGTLLSFLLLRLVGRRLFGPVEEADRKQKQFIANAETELKLPLTVISAETELLELTHGSSDQTRSIHRQVRKMNTLVRKLGSLAIFEDKDLTRTEFDFSELLRELLERSSERFAARGVTLRCEIEPQLRYAGEQEAMGQVCSELIENALCYAVHTAEFSLRRDGERIQLTASNDSTLPDGQADQVFDRFTVLQNAREGSAGLGLAYVKEIVRAHDGRCTAKVADGCFTVRLDL